MPLKYEMRHAPPLDSMKFRRCLFCRRHSASRCDPWQSRFDPLPSGRSLIEPLFQVGIKETDHIILNERSQNSNWRTVGRGPVSKRMGIAWNRHDLIKRGADVLDLERALHIQNLVPRHRVFLTVNQEYRLNVRVRYQRDRRILAPLHTWVTGICVVFNIGHKLVHHVADVTFLLALCKIVGTRQTHCTIRAVACVPVDSSLCRRFIQRNPDRVRPATRASNDTKLTIVVRIGPGCFHQPFNIIDLLKRPSGSCPIRGVVVTVLALYDTAGCQPICCGERVVARILEIRANVIHAVVIGRSSFEVAPV